MQQKSCLQQAPTEKDDFFLPRKHGQCFLTHQLEKKKAKTRQNLSDPPTVPLKGND
jgi:hypothetical protein